MTQGYPVPTLVAGIDQLGDLSAFPGLGLARTRNLGVATPDTAFNITDSDSPLTLSGLHEYVPIDASGGAFSVLLPAAKIAGATVSANTRGAHYVISKIDSSAFVVTITPNGTDKINGVNAAIKLGRQYAYWELYCVSDATAVTPVAQWFAVPHLPANATDMVAMRKITTPVQAVAAGDFALDAGWGDTATKTILAGSTDLWGRIDILCQGAGITASPSWSLTYKDGAFPSPGPQFIMIERGGNATWTHGLSAVSTTGFSVVIGITPVSGTTYRFNYALIG